MGEGSSRLRSFGQGRNEPGIQGRRMRLFLTLLYGTRDSWILDMDSGGGVRLLGE